MQHYTYMYIYIKQTIFGFKIPPHCSKIIYLTFIVVSIEDIIDINVI